MEKELKEEECDEAAYYKLPKRKRFCFWALRKVQNIKYYLERL